MGFDVKYLRAAREERFIAGLVTQTFNMLAQQVDLSPANPAVTRGLSRLVSKIAKADDRAIDHTLALNNASVNAVRPQLLQLLSKAEYEMEMYYSRLLGAEDTLSVEDLSRFIYRENYRELVAQEVRGLRDCADFEGLMRDDRRAIFVGAGPLPLTAIDLYLQTGKKCVCADNDRVAVEAGRTLVEKLGLSDAITFIEADGRDIDYADYSLVMVASLVGQKEAVLRRIDETDPDPVVAVRSADGLKTLLYEPFNIEEISCGAFEYYGKALAGQRTINSTFFFGRPRPGN